MQHRKRLKFISFTPKFKDHRQSVKKTGEPISGNRADYRSCQVLVTARKDHMRPYGLRQAHSYWGFLIEANRSQQEPTSGHDYPGEAEGNQSKSTGMSKAEESRWEPRKIRTCQSLEEAISQSSPINGQTQNFPESLHVQPSSVHSFSTWADTEATRDFQCSTALQAGLGWAQSRSLLPPTSLLMISGASLLHVPLAGCRCTNLGHLFWEHFSLLPRWRSPGKLCTPAHIGVRPHPDNQSCVHFKHSIMFNSNIYFITHDWIFKVNTVFP